MCPPQVLDAPLTEVGRTQAKALRATTAALHPTLLPAALKAGGGEGGGGERAGGGDALPGRG